MSRASGDSEGGILAWVVAPGKEKTRLALSPTPDPISSQELQASVARELRAQLEHGLGGGPTPPGGPGDAAVLALLRVHGRSTEVLMIQRARRVGDPWSGHIALPGGRWQASDADLSATALRESYEEVGLDRGDLETPPLFVSIRAPANRPTMKVGILVGVLRDGLGGPNSPGDEVADLFWVPVHALRPTEGPVDVMDGQFRAPALLYQDRVVWGFTRGVFLDLMSRFGRILP